MYTSRHLQQASIALLCLWVTLMLQAMNELFQESYQYQHPNQRYYSSAYEEFMHKHHHPTGHVMIRNQNTKKQYHQREDPDPAMHPTLRHHHHGKTNHSMSLSSSANGTMPMTRGFGKKHHHHHPKRLHFGNATKLKEAVALAEQKTLLPGPIIVVGFPKAGTSSIFTFFRNQHRRMKCQHWVSNLECLVSSKGGARWSLLVARMMTKVSNMPFAVLLPTSKVCSIGWTCPHGRLYAGQFDSQSVHLSPLRPL